MKATTRTTDSSKGEKSVRKPIYSRVLEGRFNIPIRDESRHFFSDYPWSQFMAIISVSVRGFTGEGNIFDEEELLRNIRTRFNNDQLMLRLNSAGFCEGVLHVVCETIGDRLIEARVTIPLSRGEASLRWVKGDTVPEFPRTATQEEVAKELEVYRGWQRRQPRWWQFWRWAEKRRPFPTF